MADSVLFYAKDGIWYVSLSDGNKFGPYKKWLEGHGVGSSKQFLEDVNGDGKAEAHFRMVLHSEDIRSGGKGKDRNLKVTFFQMLMGTKKQI